MRIAIISDIHGNLTALDTVLKDAAGAAIDKIVFLGDAATLGPSPSATLGRLREIDCPCIQGNHDACLLDVDHMDRYAIAPETAESFLWAHARLSSEDFDFLKKFKPQLEMPLEGHGALMFCHGSPRSNVENILADTESPLIDEMLDGRRPGVMACGHTHLPMVRRHRDMLIVNPGSVGFAFREFANGREPVLMPWAEYAIVDCRADEMAVDLRRLALDLDKLRAEIQAVDNPLSPWQLGQYA